MDKHKKKNTVHFAISEEETATLYALASKIGRPTATILGHFFEAMTEIGFEASLFLPPIPSFREKGESLTVRVSDESHEHINTEKDSRTLTKEYIGRLLFLRTCELCERHKVQVMPTKEDIRGWVTHRAAEVSSVVAGSAISNFFGGFFGKRK